MADPLGRGLESLIPDRTRQEDSSEEGADRAASAGDAG
ncbi:MAG: hypothetical protein Greene071436_377, partial [Parcubacteria group bacterium Greene0714_36]